MDLQNLMIMKTLKDLKAFSLDKKQMNQIEGGKTCADVQAEITLKSRNWSDGRWIVWEHLQQMTRGEEAQGWSNEKWDEWAEAWDTHCW